MVSKIRSIGLSGLHGYMVSVECFLSGGLPSFDVVGLPDAATKESRERVKAAMRVCGYDFPQRHITVNLAPADQRKEGTAYDLPLFLGLVTATGELAEPPEDCAFLGELSLEGELRRLRGILPMAMAAARMGIKRLFVPEKNAREAAIVQELTVYPVRHIRELTAHFSGNKRIKPEPVWAMEEREEELPDFRDVKGQEMTKRALEIAAAGGHNLLMVGPPGSGKSMMARRLPSILPRLTREESVEVSEIYSVAGCLPADKPLVTARPFRHPHNSVSGAGLLGGGAIPRPGEMSLAHHGVLFLDELPEFQRDVLEAMRQPLEDGTVTISRAAATMSFPSRFMLVGAMNPCRCGWHGHSVKNCTCSGGAVEKYFGKISGPLLDRMDIQIEVPDVKYAELSGRETAEPSEAIRKRVEAARARQRERYQDALVCNAQLTPAQVQEFCRLDEESGKLLESAFHRLGLTARSYDRILKVSRTIADLDGCEQIQAKHLAEALQYRQLNRA